MIEKKVFCIGFNKTGTTSLHNFFRNAGLESTHNATWPKLSFSKNVQHHFSKNTCYSDGEKANFVRLKNAFSGSIFILNTRALKPWLHSRVKHVFRYGDPKGFQEEPKNWGWMARDFFTDEVMALDSWIIDRHLYHSYAREFFSGYEGFLEIDITTQRGWGEIIGAALQKNGIPVLGTLVEERKNVRNSVNNMSPDLLEKYLRLADERIEKINSLYGNVEN